MLKTSHSILYKNWKIGWLGQGGAEGEMDKHLINANTSALNIYRFSYSRSLNVPETVSTNFYWLCGCNCT